MTLSEFKQFLRKLLAAAFAKDVPIKTEVVDRDGAMLRVSLLVDAPFSVGIRFRVSQLIDEVEIESTLVLRDENTSIFNPAVTEEMYASMPPKMRSRVSGFRTAIGADVAIIDTTKTQLATHEFAKPIRVSFASPKVVALRLKARYGQAEDYLAVYGKELMSWLKQRDNINLPTRLPLEVKSLPGQSVVRYSIVKENKGRTR